MNLILFRTDLHLSLVNLLEEPLYFLSLPLIINTILVTEFVKAITITKFFQTLSLIRALCKVAVILI
jgi:hypothetical protein